MRIYITSRNRTPSSTSPSDFMFSLERPIELPEGAVGIIDSFTCSNVWEAVLAGVNQTLFFQFNDMAQQTVELEPGDRTSVADLATKLTTGLAALNPFEPPCNSYSVWEQVGVRLSWARGWPTLHGGLAQDLELRSFSVYATIGGLGRCLRPGRGNDQGHPMYKPAQESLLTRSTISVHPRW